MHIDGEFRMLNLSKVIACATVFLCAAFATTAAADDLGLESCEPVRSMAEEIMRHRQLSGETLAQFADRKDTRSHPQRAALLRIAKQAWALPVSDNNIQRISMRESFGNDWYLVCVMSRLPD